MPTDFKVIPRSAWNAAPPKEPLAAMTSTANGCFIHHSVTAAPPKDTAKERAAMRDLQQIAFSRGFDDFSYSFAIMPSGRIYEGRGKGKAGAHTLNYNSTSYGIVFVGNYETQEPTEAQLKAAKWLIHKHLKLGSKPIRGHRQVYATACPGDKLYAKLNKLR